MVEPAGSTYFCVPPTRDAARFDVQVERRNWSVDLDVKQMFINTAVHLNHGAFATAHTELGLTVPLFGQSKLWQGCSSVWVEIGVKMRDTARVRMVRANSHVGAFPGESQGSGAVRYFPTEDRTGLL